MSVKSNPVPEHFRALCSSNSANEAVKLNVHLRRHNIDARYLKDRTFGPSVMVPPEQLGRARKVYHAWLKEGSDVKADYRAVQERTI